MKKILFSMLALLLAMGGAWAQGPTAAEIPASTLSGWNDDYTPITAADLPGFVAVDSATADQWENASTNGYAVLIYAFTTDGQAKHIYFQPGLKSWETYDYMRDLAYENYDHECQVFYTTGGGAIKLTPDATGKVWTLAETPDYDLDLQVVYYQKYALKEIPANWQVKVDGVDKTAAIDHDSLMITETAQVLLTPDHPERVKKVILVDEAVAPQLQTIHVGGMANATLYYMPGDTWGQAIARPENTGFGIQGSWVTYNGLMINYQGNPFPPDTEVNPNAEYEAII